MGQTLRSKERIRGRKDFQLIFKKGKCAKGGFLNLWVYEGPEVSGAGSKRLARLGIVVSRRVDLRAAKRNLWKRRIREAWRRKGLRPLGPMAVVIQAKKQGKAPSFQALTLELTSLLEKTGRFA